MTRTHTLATAANIINTRTWCAFTDKHLRAELYRAGMIYQDLSGDWITTPQADNNLVRTVYGHHTRTMPDGSRVYAPHAMVRLTDAGLDWIETQLQTANAA